MKVNTLLYFIFGEKQFIRYSIMSLKNTFDIHFSFTWIYLGIFILGKRGTVVYEDLLQRFQ